MALNKQDYVNQGVAMAAESQTRPVGDSWQVKAQQLGFDSVVRGALDARLCNEQQPPIGPIPEQFKKTPGIGGGSVEARECYPVAHNSTPAPTRFAQTYCAVQSHVNALYRQAMDPKTPTMRAYKIGEKIGALINKWKSKGVIIRAGA